MGLEVEVLGTERVPSRESGSLGTEEGSFCPTPLCDCKQELRELWELGKSYQAIRFQMAEDN